MKIYLKWSLLILGPFILLVAGLIYYKYVTDQRYSRDELDESYNRIQVERNQVLKKEKEYLDKQWQKQERPQTGEN